MNKNRELEVIEVKGNQILVELDGNEVVLDVVAPADVKYIKKPGKYTVGFNPQGQVNYAKLVWNAAPSNVGFNSYKPKPVQNTFKPADSFKEEKPFVPESQYVSYTMALKDKTWDEVWDIYNQLSLMGTWIKASNTEPLPTGKYNAVFFISEKKEFFNAKNVNKLPIEVLEKMDELVKLNQLPDRIALLKFLMDIK